LRLDTIWQDDRCRCLQNRKLPAVAGDVPIKLVIIIEEPELTIRAIGDPERVWATAEQERLAVLVGTTDVDARAAVDPFLMPLLGLTIPLDGYHTEIDFPLAPGGIDELQWKVTENAATNSLAFGIDGNRLDDLQRATAINSNRLIEPGNILSRRRCMCQEDRQKRNEHASD
jgi:hypothetical protein